ncbi:transposase [Marinibactrum halimedae]|uniref:transposase n=1 Tax=Marinibactrum halimedae TaxID=1444977 RepID=UPI001E4BE7E6|nr:transposase [Marinibactrum halimedae]MCD9459870.1 transposase [Marinibactrum halimedae]
MAFTVMLRWDVNGKKSKALLFSTDIRLDAMKIIQYYKARFQIEFLFHDAKQHTGLVDCQSRKKKQFTLRQMLLYRHRISSRLRIDWVKKPMRKVSFQLPAGSVKSSITHDG